MREQEPCSHQWKRSILIYLFQLSAFGFQLSASVGGWRQGRLRHRIQCRIPTYLKISGGEEPY